MSKFAMAAILALTVAYMSGRNMSGVTNDHHTKFGEKRCILSPRDTLIPYICQHDAIKMAYPPHVMPGARDVATPAGTMRVYEWGPESGRKVVFVHGLTTPSPIFSKIAHSLVDRGCRVILFDLWGVGYSDSPLKTPHDVGLFSMQLTFATQSSTISAAEFQPFSLIGYSLGGPIAMKFAADFPDKVSSIILLAPGGLMPRLPKGYNHFSISHPSLVPKSYLEKRISKLLDLKWEGRLEHLNRDMRNEPRVSTSAQTSTNSEHLSDIDRLMQWQLAYHHGFPNSFCSAVVNGPICGQHEVWKAACEAISGRRGSLSPLRGSRLLVLFGIHDEVVVGREIESIVRGMLSDEYVEFSYLEGDHTFPMSRAELVVDHITRFWQL